MTCPKCRGTGFIAYKDDPSAAGVSLSPGYMIGTDPCPDCYEKSICPMCGQKLPITADWTTHDCSTDSCPCGWTYLEGEEQAIGFMEYGE